MVHDNCRPEGPKCQRPLAAKKCRRGLGGILFYRVAMSSFASLRMRRRLRQHLSSGLPAQ